MGAFRDHNVRQRFLTLDNVRNHYRQTFSNVTLSASTSCCHYLTSFSGVQYLQCGLSIVWDYLRSQQPLPQCVRLSECNWWRFWLPLWWMGIWWWGHWLLVTAHIQRNIFVSAADTFLAYHLQLEQMLVVIFDLSPVQSVNIVAMDQ